MILSDRDIKILLKSGELVIDPLSDDTIRENGVDLKLGREYCAFKKTNTILDPNKPGNANEFYECDSSDSFVVESHRHYLLHTLEYIKLPSYLAGLVNLRSTWARTGIYIPSTVTDAGFEGQLTIEVIGSEFPVKLYAGDRFLHLILVKMETPSEKPYEGNYKGQTGVRLPKFFNNK
ncbi:MAG: dCTP deaminase [Caldisphaera sp.]|jgi:dCTP deaminase|uniref:dCTP deaminase n=1 Tax=Caldisphaera sp. TaxID=2060322 RepID=UPI000CC5DD54|nr:MAG: dCTP deaminase [Caldisphaera sp.]PMP89358.1 MAG: dCTP deaminase [Caldisphaera sp.]